MKNLIRISAVAVLMSSASVSAFAQDVPNQLRQNLVNTYAAFAEAFEYVRNNGDAGDVGTYRREMNVKRAEFIDLCGRANIPDYAQCVVEFIPMQDRTQPDKALGAQGQNIVADQPSNNGNNGQNNGGNNNNGGNSNNNGGQNNGGGNNGGNEQPSDQTAQVRQAADRYNNAVNRLNAAIDNGNDNPVQLMENARTARAELRDACSAAGINNVNSCTSRLNIEILAMPEMPARENVDNENAAPILDSQKETENSGRASTPPIGINLNIDVPQNDQDSQANVRNQPVISVQEEQGTRIDQQPIEERPTGRVIEDFGDRQVVDMGGQVVIRSNEENRLATGSSETYYEDLSRDRTRETIIRPNGTRLVTIYNANGDILQRSRFDQNGTETVLVYVAPEQEQQLANNTDPGANLPPLQLGIPADEYIMDADEADLDEVIRFLNAPPVEQVQRYYSIDEVKRSARIRDMVRRLEIGNLTFEFGSANLAPDQVNGLYELANAIQVLLEQNPGEVFLIEGHTDAVGSEYANLLLSDRRAENVARLLSEAYGIPPENLATQGYGERYLKVNTPYEERLNRRVTVKRITPLIAPVNTAAAG